jgi:hypothetical protein
MLKIHPGSYGTGVNPFQNEMSWYPFTDWRLDAPESFWKLLIDRDKFIDTFGPKDNSGKLLKLEVFGIFFLENFCFLFFWRKNESSSTEDSPVKAFME